MDNSSYFSYINNPRSLVRSFRRKFILFYTRYFNRYTRGRFNSSSNCMGSSHTESAYWVYSRNMFSCIRYTATRGYEKPSCRSWYYRSFIRSRLCSNCHHDFISTASSFLPLGAFLGAFITAMVIYALSWQKGHHLQGSS